MPPGRLRPDADPRRGRGDARTRSPASTPSWPSWPRATPGRRQRGPPAAGRTAAAPSRMSDLGPAAAYLTLEALTEVNRPDEEGFWKQFSSSKWVAWKTGHQLRPAGRLGGGSDARPTRSASGPGNADGEGNPDLTGLSTAAPVLFDILQALDTGGAHARPPPLAQGDPRLPRFGLPGRPSSARPRRVHDAARKPFPAGRALTTRLVHLDASAALPGRFRLRVDRRACGHEPWFVLPPVQEYYYRPLPSRSTAPCRPSAPTAPDVVQAERGLAGHEPGLSRRRTRAVYVPVDLDGEPGQVVFEAVHRRPETHHLLAPRRPLSGRRRASVPPDRGRPGAGPAPAGADRTTRAGAWSGRSSVVEPARGRGGPLTSGPAVPRSSCPCRRRPWTARSSWPGRTRGPPWPRTRGPCRCPPTRPTAGPS
ncbi:MAG: hypothetical protein MZV64_68070 [Ignavibacteriales bacterium]|nr:hypothetical protein [Ignavibacteriales bacterium]